MTKQYAFLVFFCLAILLGAAIYFITVHKSHHAPAVVSPSAPTSSSAGPGGNTLPSNGISGGATAPSMGNKGATEQVFVPRVGETLEYDANVAKLNSTIANLQLQVRDKKSLQGKPVWHFQASAHTENPYRMVFELDDQFDSYSEPASMGSLQYEMHLSERGQKAEFVQRLLPSTAETAPSGMIAARVPPGTRDPLGLLAYLRGVDWNKTAEIQSPVYDGRKMYDVRARRVSKSEAVSVPAGKYDASKIEIRVLEGGAEMKDAHFLLYLANDASRLPVLMEAVLPVATARVELTRAN